MKTKTLFYILLAFLLLLSVGAKSQNTFSKIFPVDTLPDGQSGMSVSLLDDGYLITANFQNDIDAALYKTDFQGRLIWKKKYQLEFSCSNPELTKVQNSHIYIGGIKLDTSGHVGSSISCLNLNGDILWHKIYRKAGFEETAQTMVYNGKDFFIVWFSYQY
jgi:hypothetical protein